MNYQRQLRIFSHTPDLSPYSFGDLTKLNNDFPPITLTELKQIIKKTETTCPWPNQNYCGTFETSSHQHAQIPTLHFQHVFINGLFSQKIQTRNHDLHS